MSYPVEYIFIQSVSYGEF